MAITYHAGRRIQGGAVTSATVSTGSTNNGTNDGSGFTQVTGLIGNGMSQSSGNYNLPPIPMGSEWSWNLWTKPQTASGNDYYMQFRSGSTQNSSFYARNGGSGFYYRATDSTGQEVDQDSSGNQLATDIDSLAGTWVMLTATWNNSDKKFRMYKNGTLVQTSKAWTHTNAGNMGTSSVNWTLGNYQSQTSSTYASRSSGLDEWSFWKGTLSQADITELYNSGNGIKATELSSANKLNLMVYYDFEDSANGTLTNQAPTTATVRDAKPTDVQVGSRFEETDTRKMYHYADIDSTTGLIAYYNFDETSGTVLINQAGTAGSSDSLGTSVNGTNVGTATVNQTGKIDKTYDFDGAGTGASNDHIAIPNALSTDLAGTNKLSYSLWFNTDEFSTSQGNGWDLIGTYGSGGGADYRGLTATYWYDGTFNFYPEYHGSFSGNSYGKITLANIGATATGTWYHLVVVYDGTATGNANRLKIYLNGVQKTFDSFQGNAVPSTITFGDYPTWIGRPVYSSTYQKNFNGKIGIEAEIRCHR